MSHAGWGVYCATKFAVEALGEALRQEVAPLGVAVMTIEPGGFRTDFLDGSSLATAKSVIEDYTETAGAIRQWAQATNHAQKGDPAKAARVIVDLAGREDLPERLQLGEDCFSAVADKTILVQQEQGVWRDVSLSTAHDDA